MEPMFKTFSPDETVLGAAQFMARERETAIVVTSGDRALRGIFTERDLLTRVVAERLDAATTLLDKVMTHDPDFVTADTSPEEALVQMHRGHYRHVPVVGADGATVIGLHDILHVTYDAVLGERANAESARNMKWRITHALKLYDKRSSFIFGETVNAAAASAKRLTFSEDESVFATVTQMARRRISAVLVTSADGALVGIFTERDLLARVVVAGRDPHTTTLKQVMTVSPTTVTPTTAPLEALEMMLEGGYRHLPVVRGKRVMGMLDMLQLTNGAMVVLPPAAAAMAAGTPASPAPTSAPRVAPSPSGVGVGASVGSGVGTHGGMSAGDRAGAHAHESSPHALDEMCAPTQCSFDLGLGDGAPAPLHSSTISAPAPLVSYFFKFSHAGSIFRASASGDSFAQLDAQIRARVHLAVADALVIHYLDDEDDPVLLASDAELADAVRLAETCAWKTIKLQIAVTAGGNAAAVMAATAAAAAASTAAAAAAAATAGGTSSSSLIEESNGSSLGDVSGVASVEISALEADGNALVQASQFAKAAVAFEAALVDAAARDADASELARLNVKLATVASILGESDQARAAYERVLGMAESAPDAVHGERLDAVLGGLAEIYLEAGRYEESVALMARLGDADVRRDALDKLAEEKDEVCNDAAALWESGDFAGAMGVYTSAIRLASAIAAATGAPGDHRLLAARGGCYYQLADYELALGDFDSALALAPEFVKAYLGRGKSLAKLARPDAARAAFATGLKIAPDHEGILAEMRSLDASRAAEKAAAAAALATEQAAAAAATAAAEAARANAVERKSQPASASLASASASASVPVSAPAPDLAAQLGALMTLTAMVSMSAPVQPSAALTAATPVSPPKPAPASRASSPAADLAAQLGALMTLTAVAAKAAETETAPAPATEPATEPATFAVCLPDIDAATDDSDAVADADADEADAAETDDSLADTLQMLAAKTRLLAAQVEMQREQERYDAMRSSRGATPSGAFGSPALTRTATATGSVPVPVGTFSSPTPARPTGAPATPSRAPAAATGEPSLADQIKALLARSEELVAAPSPTRRTPGAMPAPHSQNASPSVANPHPHAASGASESLAMQLQQITAMTAALANTASPRGGVYAGSPVVGHAHVGHAGSPGVGSPGSPALARKVAMRPRARMPAELTTTSPLGVPGKENRYAAPY